MQGAAGPWSAAAILCAIGGHADRDCVLRAHRSRAGRPALPARGRAVDSWRDSRCWRPSSFHSWCYRATCTRGGTGMFFCGAAAAQMVLRGLGAPLFKQEPLYGQNHSYPTIDPASGWASPPDGLTATLERNKPSTVAATFALGVADSADAISQDRLVHSPSPAPGRRARGG